MILKFQRSLDGKAILVYNKDRKALGQFEYKEEHESVFNGKRKVFVKGKIDRHGMVKIQTIVNDREW